MLGGADNPNGELLSYIIGADTLHHFVQGTDISCTGPLLKSQSDSRAGSRKINVLQHTLNNTEPVELLGCDVDSQCAGEGFSCLDSSCLQGSIAIAG
ncbi:hypothetical protein G874_02200, partial [Escherichia coli HVH 223 (4-2976528)]